MTEALLALLDERVGFGRLITGGASGCVYHVTNANDSGPGSLREGAEAGNRWIVFDGDYAVRLNSPLHLAGSLTIDGRGRRVEIAGYALRIEGAPASNVILENLILTHAVHAGRGATRLWLDRVTMPDAEDDHMHITNPNPATAGAVARNGFFPTTSGTPASV